MSRLPGSLGGHPGLLLVIYIRGRVVCKSQHFAQGFLQFSAVPVWFHAVPMLFTFMQMLVSSQRNAHRRRGSSAVPCGSYCLPTQQIAVSSQRNLHQGVVPVWFHMVPMLFTFMQMLVSFPRNAHRRRGSSAVPCGSYV